MANQNVYIEIAEQPKSTALRFRYITESRKAGSIMGEYSSKSSQSYPAIKINNYSGPLVAKMFCVTEQGHLHPHKLVGQNCPDDHGVCIVCVNETLPDSIIRFSNVGIQCSKRDDIRSYLDAKKKVLPECHEPTNLNTIDLTCVRLMFKVYLGPDLHPIEPVMSRVIYDKKHCCDLTITRISIKSAPANGGAELFILCNKVKKEDLQVVFADNSWQDYGTFLPPDVFKECVVICRVPSYRYQNIQGPVDVKLFLRQPSTQEVGTEHIFTYTPIDHDPYRINSKRRKMADHQQVGMPFAHNAVNQPPSSIPAFPDVVLHHDANQIGTPDHVFAEGPAASKAHDWPSMYYNHDSLGPKYQPPPHAMAHQVIGPDILKRGNRNMTFTFCNQPQIHDHSNPFNFIPNHESKVPLHVEQVNSRTQAGSNEAEWHNMVGSMKLHQSTPQFVEIKSETSAGFDDFPFGNKPMTVGTKKVHARIIDQKIHKDNQNANVRTHMESKQDLPKLSGTSQSLFTGLPRASHHGSDHNNMPYFSAIHTNQMSQSSAVPNQMSFSNTPIVHANPLLDPSTYELDPCEFDGLIFPELGDNFSSLNLEDIDAFMQP